MTGLFEEGGPLATRKDIPTDLALEIGADLEPRHFVAAMREFLALVGELARAPEESGFEWRAKVCAGSNILALFPAEEVEESVSGPVLDRVHEGIRALAQGNLSHALVTEGAVRHARQLSDLADGGREPVQMRIWAAREPVDYGQQVAAAIRKSEEASYSDYGSIEGTLRVIADDNGRLKIRVDDPLLEQAIPCRVPDEQIEDVIQAFRKRVEVTGLIHYNGFDRPTSIKAEKLEVLPDDSVLPGVEDIRGLFAEGA